MGASRKENKLDLGDVSNQRAFDVNKGVGRTEAAAFSARKPRCQGAPPPYVAVVGPANHRDQAIEPVSPSNQLAQKLM